MELHFIFYISNIKKSWDGPKTPRDGDENLMINSW